MTEKQDTDPAAVPRGPILLVGCGRMGGALLAGWTERGFGPVTIVEPQMDRVPPPPAAAGGAAKGAAREGAVPAPTLVASAEHLPAGYRPAVVVLAVKPQVMDDVLPPYARFAGTADTAGAVFLSIAAGRTVRSLTRLLGAGTAVVRSMPNTPAAIGAGMTVACATDTVAEPQRQLCHQLLEAVGDVRWVAEEPLLDAVTAVSGSGPAYVFHLVEALAKAGEAVGLDPALSAHLARRTVTGAGALLAQAPEEPAELRRNVTSPGGTTAAALEVLMADPDGLTPLLRRAVAAAEQRSRELAGG